MPYYEETLERDMRRIREKVSEMAGLAEKALRGCLQAIKEQNRQKAYSVILRDSRIDELEKQIDRLCLEFIVRQQPVAGTLRFAYASIKINSEIERVGDYAESMARHILLLPQWPEAGPLERIEQIANMVIPMFQDAVRSFVTNDAELAKRTRQTEASVDALRHKISGELVKAREDQQIPLESLVPLLTLVNRFERTADQATNICQEVIYMSTGEYAKHKGTEVYRVLFVDERNACRSQIAEGIGNALNQPKFIFSSAGLNPYPVDPAAITFMAEKGIDISRHRSHSVEHVPNLEHYNIIVALAPGARQVFPPPPTKTVSLDWSVGDPSQVEGTPEDIKTAYEDTYEFLRAHLQDLVEAILGDEIT